MVNGKGTKFLNCLAILPYNINGKQVNSNLRQSSYFSSIFKYGNLCWLVEMGCCLCDFSVNTVFSPSFICHLNFNALPICILDFLWFQKRKHDGDEDINDVHKHKKSKVIYSNLTSGLFTACSVSVKFFIL